MRTDLTIAEAAQLTGLHPETLRRHIRRGKLPAYRIGQGVYLIRYEDFEQIRQGQRTEVATGGEGGSG